MKLKTLTASLALAFFVLPAIAQANPLSHTEAVSYGRAYAHVTHVLGKGAAGCKLIGPKATCHRVTDGKIRRSTDVLHRMLAPPPAPAPVVSTGGVSYSSTVTSAATAASETSQAVAKTNVAAASSAQYSSPGDLSNVPGVPSSFAACVALHESTNGTNGNNIYGIIPASGVSGVAGSSVASQKAAFSHLYAQVGASGWAPYDGC